MVLSIPQPDLNTLLPPFLAHLPTAITSPRAPPSLPALLAPITRARLSHLSFNNSSTWLSLISWYQPEQAQDLEEHLKCQDYYFIHQPPSPNTFIYKGSRRLDVETLQSLVEVPELKTVIVYQYIIDEKDLNSEENGWKVFDIRFTDDEESLGTWFDSVEAAEEEFRSSSSKLSSVSSPSKVDYPTTQEEVDEDDYWGRYDEEETESSAGDYEQPASSNQAYSPSTYKPEYITSTSEDDYYSRYADVETVLESGAPATTTTTNQPEEITTRRFSSSSSKPSLTSPTQNHFSYQDSTTSISTPATVHTTSNNTIHKSPEKSSSEEKDGFQLQTEIAVKQHISTTIKSMYRLWKASGLDSDDFHGLVERELEVLSIIEDHEERMSN